MPGGVVASEGNTPRGSAYKSTSDAGGDVVGDETLVGIVSLAGIRYGGISGSGASMHPC